MVKRSRRTRVKRKRESRLALVYIVLAVVIMIATVIWGIPAMARLAGMLFTNDAGITDLEELAPTPPVFSDIPESTSSASVSMTGFAQPGVEVVLVMDGSELERTLTNDAGIFEFENIAINEGESRVAAYSLTSRGTESELSKEYLIRVDRTAPELTLTEPENEKVFRGQKERIAKIKGSVSEDGVHVYIGDRVAIVASDNSFELAYQLQEGDQEIEIRAVDKAENETKTSLKLRWEP